MMRKLNIRGVIMLSQGAPVWVGWLSAIICLSLLFTACIIYIRQVWLKLWTSCISWGVTGTPKSMEVYFCTTAHLFKGLPGGSRWERERRKIIFWKRKIFWRWAAQDAACRGLLPPDRAGILASSVYNRLGWSWMARNGNELYHVYWNPGSSAAMGRTSAAVCFRQ